MLDTAVSTGEPTVNQPGLWHCCKYHRPNSKPNKVLLSMSVTTVTIAVSTGDPTINESLWPYGAFSFILFQVVLQLRNQVLNCINSGSRHCLANVFLSPHIIKSSGRTKSSSWGSEPKQFKHNK